MAESPREYKGPVLLNPGGPGGSGVELIRQLGDTFSSALGPQFDIVSFDPRGMYHPPMSNIFFIFKTSLFIGIGQSAPRVAPFRTAAERALWYTSDLHNAEDDVPNTWARALVLGQMTKDRDDGYLGHINTDQTARDMLRIVEAHGRTKIQYWGFS